jgi:DNA-binding NtrC family response regulator
MPETKGYMGDAEGGDLFLDEIACLSPVVQAILLRALENGYERVGETETRPKRCKVTAATNKGAGSLAEDVLMRFGTVVHCLPLRARPSDTTHVARVALLAAAKEHADFAAKFLRQDSRGWPYVASEQSLIANLTRHPLPGNARQVKILVDTAVREARRTGRLRWPSAVPAPKPRELETTKEAERLADDDVDAQVEAALQGLDAAVRLEAERERAAAAAPFGSAERPMPSKSLTIEALDRRHWRFGPAARDLGISEPQLYRLRIKYGLHSPQGAQDPQNAE